MNFSRLSRTSILAILLILLSGLGNAGQHDNPFAAYAEGDYAQAFKLSHPMALQGDAGAQYLLGAMYFLGQGVPQDDKQAVDWYRKAAVQGDAGAQFLLGWMYDEGQGVPQDYVRAHMWFNLAAAQGDSGAVKERDLVASEMTAAQIAEAQKLARECEQRNYRGCD